MMFWILAYLAYVVLSYVVCRERVRAFRAHYAYDTSVPKYTLADRASVVAASLFPVLGFAWVWFSTSTADWDAEAKW